MAEVNGGAEAKGAGKRRRRWWLWVLILLVLIVGVPVTLEVCGEAKPEDEVPRLAELLDLRPGMAVAEIGSGKGRMTVLVAKHMWPSDRVFSTELDPARVRDIQEAVTRAGLTNVTVIKAGERESNLPEGCCDAIFMFKVYHHFTDPASMDASLFRALRPGGALAVIDFTPRFWRYWLWRPSGVPENHCGHGIAPELLIQEMASAGFRLERTIGDWRRWPADLYCTLFRRPAMKGS